MVRDQRGDEKRQEEAKSERTSVVKRRSNEGGRWQRDIGDGNLRNGRIGKGREINRKRVLRYGM